MKLDRRDVVAIVALFFAAAASFAWWAVSDELGGVGGDNAVYVLTARHYSPLLPANVVAREFAEQSQYPPLYPLSLSFFSGSLAWMHAVTALELALAVAALLAWSIVQGLPRWAALIVPTLFALMPGTYLEALQIHSEPLYLALSVLALLQFDAARRNVGVRDDLLLTIVVTAAALTRTVGISLFVPLLLALRKRSPSVWLRCAIVAAPFGLWHLVHAPAHSYTSVLAHSVGADPSRYWSSLWGSVNAIRRGWSESLFGGNVSSSIADAILVMCLLASSRRALRGCADGWYAIAYFAVIVLWNFPAEAARFAWAILPIMIVQLLLELHALASRQAANAAQVTVAAALAALAICVAPSLALAVQRVRIAGAIGLPLARHVPEWFKADPELAEEETVTYLSTMAALRRARQLVPEQDCIEAVKPSVVALITDRRSVALPPADATDDAFRAGVASCRYVLMLGYRTPSYPEAMYPQARLSGRAEEIFHQSAELSNGATGDVAILARLIPG